VRAIRLSLKERRLLDTQLAAMLRAASIGPVQIMLPMISRSARSARTRGGRAGYPTDTATRHRTPKAIHARLMIEVPGAAVAADGWPP